MPTIMLVSTAHRMLRIAALASALGLAECRVDDTLDDRPWPCDTSEQCGDHDGKPMQCWEGFCMPSCDYEHPPDDSGKRCLVGDVLVETCDPSSAEPGCKEGFDCYRTDLALAEGVCVPFATCSRKEDCGDPDLNVCATQVIEGIVGEDRPIFADHLACLATNCALRNEDCPPGYDCLGRVYRLEAYGAPDICVPKCAGNVRCLPNYTCANSNVAEGVDPICIPGFPGVRCVHDQDCIYGSCRDTGAGFSMCTTSCEVDADCSPLNTSPRYFRCVSGPDGKHCVDTAPFQGLWCKSDGDCTDGASRCVTYSPYEPGEPEECRPPCGPDHKCPPRGGLAQVCLPEDDTCYPGLFGMPCQDHPECLTPFSCQAVALDERAYIRSEKICTVECDDDGDCEADPNAPKSLENQELGYCDGKWCRMRFLEGVGCDRSEQCRSKICEGETPASEEGKTCAPLPD